jgi:Domain of unknown function (DUF3535)
MGCLPEKLHPVVKPLMEAIKKEHNELFQVDDSNLRVTLSYYVCCVEDSCQAIDCFDGHVCLENAFAQC